MSQDLPLLRENLDRLGMFIRQERSVLTAILTYAVAVGAFSLIIPLTVQELVNTFAFAVSPVMVVTLVGIMAVILLFVGVFRVLQFYATDVLERRVFVRVALALAQVLPRFKEDSFRTDSISRFFETIFMQRALANLFVDFTNVFIGGFIGMILLALYHPYFLIFDVILVGSTFLIFALGKGGLRTTIHMSEAKYDAFHWFQEVADNLLHFKTTRCLDLVVGKADNLATAYVKARQHRFSVLLRQYIGSLSIQIMLHTGLLGTAGWLLSKGELTLGQLVAAEVIVASLLLNLESVVKRLYIVYYFFTALTELDHLFSLPQDRATTDSSDFSIPQSAPQGVHLACSGIRLTNAWWSIPKDVNFEALPGEKCALICQTESTRHGISLVVAGLQAPSTGVVRYNGIDVRNVSLDEVNELRGIVFGRDLRLFESSMADNITMGRAGIESEDLLWALNVVELNQEIDELPDGLQTIIKEGGRDFTPSQQLRILLARAIITRPSLLILDGALHEIPSHIREPIFAHLCSKDVPWTLVVVTTDSHVRTVFQKCISLS